MNNPSPWQITPQQVIDSHEASVLVFHNVYPEGKQGGIELILHGERIATNGDLRLEATPGQWSELPGMRGDVPRSLENGAIRVALAFAKASIAYTVRIWTEADAVEIAVDLDQPVTPEWLGKLGFQLELQPGALMGKSYWLDGAVGHFPRQANGPMIADGSSPLPLAAGKRFVAALDDPLCRLEITSHAADLQLLDGRSAHQNGWFVVRSAAAPGQTQSAVRWTLKPNRVAGWLRPPQILLSQVGYHPDQQKQALIELDPRAELEECMLLRLSPDGDPVVVQQGLPEDSGRFLRYRYARFDFSIQRQPGLYRLQYGSHASPPFQVSPQVYQRDVWQPTLDTFFPVQMCHVRVEDFERVWHGACHLDDALQAPANHEHFDGYRQYAEPDTSFAEFEHIPHLDRGGWHDAGDYDLAAGSQAGATYQLALARESFGVDWDQTTVLPEERRVLLHTPDGIPDFVQQVAHGVENLLSGYRVAGHSFAGIIEGSLAQYTHLGDAATMTDNLVYQPENSTSPRDDRWAFTNSNTTLEYQVAAALAAASRVLRGFEDGLAVECLQTAQTIWQTEQAREPVLRQVVYVGNQPQSTEVMAAVELLLSTGADIYARRLVELLPVIEERFGMLGWCVVRVIDRVKDDAFAARLETAAHAYQQHLQSEMDASPFRLPFGPGWLRANQPGHDPFAKDYHPPIWGIGWNLQSFAVHYYYLAQAFPQVFEREPLLRVLNYVLGCHPANALSLVSGVGAQSLTVAYGVNRAEWSYTPGGIASGPALIRPDWLELLDPFPWLWQQKEYVIGGAASYIFLVLAAERLLNGPAESN